MDKLQQLKKIIHENDNIVFFGGAGVSTESGIPDFRSESGIFKSLEKYGDTPERLVSHSYYLEHTDKFFSYYKDCLIFPEAEPNPAHYTLARLEKEGKLKAIITQNIDGLHQKAGSKNVLELHGIVYRNYCEICKKEYDLNRDSYYKLMNLVGENYIRTILSNHLHQLDSIFGLDDDPRIREKQKQIRALENEINIIRTNG